MTSQQRQSRLLAVRDFVKRALDLNPDGVPGYELKRVIQERLFCTEETADDYLADALSSLSVKLGRDGWAPKNPDSTPTAGQLEALVAAVRRQAEVFSPGVAPWWSVREEFFRAIGRRHEALFWNAILEIKGFLAGEYDASDYGVALLAEATA